MISTMPTPAPIPYRRSGFQVALLLFVTFGLYVFVWAFQTRRWCSATLQRQDQPLWKSIALIVPIFNLALLFELGQSIKSVAARSELAKTKLALGWLTILSFVIGALWRLPDPYWFLTAFDFVPLAVIQLVFVRAEIALDGPAAAPTRFHWVEWIFIVLGSLVWVLAAAGSWVPDATGDLAPFPWLPAAILVCSAAVLFAFARVSRRDVARLV
jgi:hypothetical protein